MIINGLVLRNLQGQVEYLTEYLQSNAVAAELGIKVVGEAENVSDIPEGEYQYGDAYMIGTEAPYELYIWTRASGNHPEDFWFNVGHFPMPGPQGEPGIGINDVFDEALPEFSRIDAYYDAGTDITTVQMVGERVYTFNDGTSIDRPETIRLPVITDGQVNITGYADVDNNHAIGIGLSKNLDNSYVALKSGTGVEGQPYVYGANKLGSTKANELKPLPIKFDTNNVVMFPATGDSSDNNTFTGTGSACKWNTILGKGNHFAGSNDSEFANTENLCFGGKNNIYSGVQDSATFGYRNEVYANQAFTHGYKNTNKGSESIVIGNQNNLDGTISIDSTPPYDGASSNSKQCAVFGNKNTLGNTNQQMLVAGDNNTIGNNCKWGIIAGSHQNIGKDNFCVNAFDYGNTSERYVEDCTMIGYYHHIYGGPDGSNKVYAVNMIGHDNTNLDSNDQVVSDVVLLGAGLKPTKTHCTVIGSYNAPNIYDYFQIGSGGDDNNRHNIFAVGNEALDGVYLTLGSTQLTETKLQALLALV